jgi:hypothetical protein
MQTLSLFHSKEVIFMEGKGKKTWIFADGDLPPAGGAEPFGHESLMIVNTGDGEAVCELTFYFEQEEPKRGITVNVGARRVRCVRLDEPLNGEGYKLPFGQYALEVSADRPVVAVFGRLDVRQNNMAYYSVQGYSC